jgi:transglutaminase-like putative cysteine protease
VIFSVRHRTEYRYGSPMADGYTVVHLLPRETPYQRVVSSEVLAAPDPDEVDEQIDLFGNRVLRFGVHHGHDRFGVESRCVVEVDDRGDADLLAGPAAERAWEDVAGAVMWWRGPIAVELGAGAAATDATPAIPAVRSMAAEVFTPGRPFVACIRELCHRIYTGFRFDPSASDVSTPLDEVVAAGGGVCQDFAHLFLAVVRSVGLSGRYVSGYIETDPPPGTEKMIGADASHAWCSVWSQDLGWIDVDPTNDQFPPSRHVTVAWGRDYCDVAPVRGVVIGPSATQRLDVAVDVTRLDDPPPDWGT